MGKYYSKKVLKAKYDLLGLPTEAVDLLHLYFTSFANLYGIIQLDDAYKIINKQNKNLLTFDKLFEFSDIVMGEKQFYCIVDADEMWTNKRPTKKIGK